LANRANLLVRLLILVGIATLPAVGVLILLLGATRADRMARLGQDALHQAELVNGDIRNILGGARQLGLAIAEFQALRRADPDCQARLRALLSELPAYAFFAAVSKDGATICLAGQAALDAIRPEIQGAIQSGQFTTGTFLAPPEGGIPALPLILPLRPADMAHPAAIVIGLSLPWLSDHLSGLRRPAGSTTVITDRNGVILARYPDGERYLGRTVKPENVSFVHAATSGLMTARGFDGRQRVVGYVPASMPPANLATAVGLPTAPLLADVAAATWHGYLLLGAGALLSMLLALFIGQRFIRAPTARLLEAARSWANGDLTARARLNEAPGTEFGSLAVAFNGMADSLGRQRAELEQLNETLEARVAERTRALVESNNKLQALISERERTEQTLHQAQKLQAVGQLAGGIAHDFNNLLTAVLGNLDLLRRHVPVDAEAMRLLDGAARTAGRGVRLTAQLLAFSRKQRLVAVPTDVNAAIATTAELLASTLGGKIRVTTDLAPGLWPAMVDPSQLEVAILNLALNARDAMPDGGELRIATSGLHLRDGAADEEELPPGDYISILVADDGIGMPPEVMARAFEPFFTTKGPGRGSGLGLSQVHGLVRQSGGDVRIDSTPGKGTRIIILLPRAPAGARLQAQAGGEKIGPPQPVSDATVLLVDDDPDVREVIAGMLAEAGCDVIARPNGASGLEALEQAGGRVRLLIADYAMPEMTGLDLIRAARARHPRLRTILATGYADLASTDDLAQLGVDTVIRKPFREQDLLRRIATALS
jgi:signal transduction histidine kinase